MFFAEPVTHYGNRRRASPVVIRNNQPAASGNDCETPKIGTSNQFTLGNFSLAFDQHIQRSHFLRPAISEDVRKDVVVLLQKLERSVGENSTNGPQLVILVRGTAHLLHNEIL